MVKFNPEKKAIAFPGCLDGIENIRTEDEAQAYLKDFIEQLQVILSDIDPVSDLGAREWAIILIMYYLGHSRSDMKVIERLSNLFLLPPPRHVDIMRILKAGILTGAFLR